MRLWENIELSVKGNMLEMARTNMNGKRAEIWRGLAHLDGEWGSRKGLLEAAVVERAERHKQERTQPQLSCPQHPNVNSTPVADFDQSDWSG